MAGKTTYLMTVRFIGTEDRSDRRRHRRPRLDIKQEGVAVNADRRG